MRVNNCKFAKDSSIRAKFNSAWKNHWKQLFLLISVRILLKLDAYLRSLGLYVGEKLSTGFVARSFARIFCNDGLSCNCFCIGMLKMQGYYLCIQVENIVVM